MNKLLTIPEAANFRGVNRSTVIRWIKKGLPARVDNFQWLIDIDDLIMFEPKQRGRPKAKNA